MVKENEKILMFVYGTLMSGYGNNRLLRNETLIGPAKTIEKYELRARGIPYVNKNNPISQIKGEVYEVSPEALPSLDSLEGHPRWYRREKIPVEINNEIKEAWIYFNPTPEGELLEDGDFRNYTKKIYRYD